MKNLIDNIKNVGLDIVGEYKDRYEKIYKFIVLCDDVLKRIKESDKHYKNIKEARDNIELFLNDVNLDITVITGLVKYILIDILFIERNYS